MFHVEQFLTVLLNLKLFCLYHWLVTPVHFDTPVFYFTPGLVNSLLNEICRVGITILYY
jgi:hypothetical protein